MFEFNNEEYTLEQIQAAAEQSNTTVEGYMKKYNIKESGKTSPTPQQGAETVDVTQAPNTGLQSASFSAESPSEQAAAEWSNNLKEGFLNKIVGRNTVDKFSNIAYNLFGEDGIRGESGPSVQAVVDKMASLYATSLKTLQDSSLSKKVAEAPIKPELGYNIKNRQKFIETVKAKDEELQQKAIKAYSDQLETEAKIKPMPSVVDGSESLGELIANVAGDATNIGLSVVPALGVAGVTTLATQNPAAGMYAGMAMSNAQLLSYMVTDFNLQKAKSQNPNLTEKEGINKLIKEGGLEFDRPAAAAIPAMALESIGFGKITKYIAGKSGLTKSLGGLMWATAGETGTEVLQLIPEGYNLAIASGMSEIDAAIDATEYFAEGAVNTALSTAAGTSAFSLLGKAGSGLGRQTWRSMRNMRVAIDENKMEQTIDEIADLKIKQFNATDPVIKEAIEEQIQTKNQELDGLVTRGAAIFNFAEDADFDSIDDLEAVKKAYIKKVKGLHDKKTEIDVEEYQEALNIYKGKYLEAQNRIKGVVSNVSERANKSAQAVEQIYQEKGKQGEAEILELYRPMAEKIADKYRNVPGFDKELLSGEILTGKRGIFDLIRSYKPEENPGVPIAAYVNKYARTRAIEAANRILDTEFTEDVTEAKKVTSTETAESTIEIAEETKQEVRTALAEDLDLDNQTQNEVISAVEKTLGTKLPAVSDKKFKQALIKGFRTELTNTFKKSFGRTAAYESFLRDNFEKIYKAIPQETINKKFKEFNEPVIDPKTGKQKREKTAVGKGLFKKRDIAKAEFIKYFTGADVPGNIKGARKTSLAEVLADEIGLDNVLNVLAKPEVTEKFKAIQELQDQKVPENFFEIISEKIDRAIERLEAYQKSGEMRSSTGIPEIVVNSTIVFAKTLRAGLKAGKNFLDALNDAISKFRKELGNKYSEEQLDTAEDIIRAEVTEDNVPDFLDLASIIENVVSGKRGEVYEKEILKALNNINIPGVKVISTEAKGSDATGEGDITVEYNGKKMNIEVKLDANAQYSSLALRTDGSLTNDTSFNKTLLKLAKEKQPAIDAYRNRALELGGTVTNSSIKISKEVHNKLKEEGLQANLSGNIEVSADIIAELYNKKNVYYIQVGEAGLFHLGKDILNLGTPKFEGTSNVTMRIRRSGNSNTITFFPKLSTWSQVSPKTLDTTSGISDLFSSKKPAESLSKQFNKVLEKSTGVEWYKTYSPVK